MMKVIALDDEPPALDIITAFCARIPGIELPATFTKTADAFSYLEKHPVDLILLDINMPALSGIDFYKSIPQRALVIFTTSYSEYAVESYNVNAVDYILKPYTFKRFEQAIGKAEMQLQMLRQQEALPDKYLILRVDYGLVKILLEDILFVEGLDNYMKIHLRDQKPVIVRLTMKTLQDKLPEPHFVRVHRSYIVALAHIEGVRKRIITIAGEEIPISISYEEGFNALFRKGEA